MITLRADADFGYGGKQHIGRVTGRDKKWGLKLDFVGTKCGKRDEMTEFRTDEPGLYKIRHWTRKNVERVEYVLLIEVNDTVREYSCDADDAGKIARELDKGRDFASVVQGGPDGWEFVSAASAEKKVVAATIDGAVDHCWQALGSLDASTAKKVLDALRKRVTPPKPAAAVGLSANAPVGVIADANQDAGVPAESVGMAPTPVTT